MELDEPNKKKAKRIIILHHFDHFAIYTFHPALCKKVPFQHSLVHVGSVFNRCTYVRSWAQVKKPTPLTRTERVEETSEEMP